FVLTSQTRYDVGLYIDTNGDPEPAVDNKGTPDFARSGQCTRFAFSNTDGVNAEPTADGCGDLTQASAAGPAGRAMSFGPVTRKCACTVNVCALRCSNDATKTCTIGGTECTSPGFCTDTLVTQNADNGTACGDQTSGDCKAPDTCQAGVCTTGFKTATTTC